jgi:hypothetical protein
MQPIACVLTGCFFMAAMGVMASCGGSAELSMEPAAPEQASALTLEGCPPAAGNDRGVGAPCTNAGGQCRGTGAPFCTLDVQPAAPFAFCTKICWSNDQCGLDATCASNPSNPAMKGCVPNACLQ